VPLHAAGENLGDFMGLLVSFGLVAALRPGRATDEQDQPDPGRQQAGADQQQDRPVGLVNGRVPGVSGAPGAGRRGKRLQEVATYSTVTRSLLALAERLAELG
jgi:hypothetical protein